MYRRSYKRYDDARARELLALFELDPRLRAAKLSKGMRTAVALVLAFSIRPRVLILDEPSSGLDPVHQRNVLDLMIDAAANGAAVLFSSHQVGQVERAADSVAIMKKGKLIVNSGIDELKTGEKIIEAVFAGPVPDLNGLAEDPRHLADRASRIVNAPCRYARRQRRDRATHLRPSSQEHTHHRPESRGDLHERGKRGSTLMAYVEFLRARRSLTWHVGILAGAHAADRCYFGNRDNQRQRRRHTSPLFPGMPVPLGTAHR